MKYEINLIITNFKDGSKNNFIIWIELLDRSLDKAAIIVTTSKKVLKRKYLTRKYLEQILLINKIIEVEFYDNYTIDGFLKNISEDFRKTLVKKFNTTVRYICNVNINQELLNDFIKRIKEREESRF